MLVALPGLMLLWIVVVMAFVLVPIGFWIFALVEVSRTPEPAFGPPWDNGKNPWILGLAVAVVVPAGILVAAILWWVQGHGALREGRPVPKPFWAPSPRPVYPYPPVPPEQPGVTPPG